MNRGRRRDVTVLLGGELMCYFNDVEVEWFDDNNSGWDLLDVEAL